MPLTENTHQKRAPEPAAETMTRVPVDYGWAGRAKSCGKPSPARALLFSNTGVRKLRLTSSIPRSGRAAKRTLDVGVSLCALVLLSPFLLMIALLIKVNSRGPVFFQQKRHGELGRIIHVLKFRSMVVHTEPPGVVTQATHKDDRVTRVGALLRRTSLDELPQLINVLRGEMSLIGPRPHPVELDYHYANLIPHYMERLRVRPGITGWAQVHGLRGPTEQLQSMVDRVDHDIWYVENWSLTLDFRIAVATVLYGLTGPNAI